MYIDGVVGGAYHVYEVVSEKEYTMWPVIHRRMPFDRQGPLWLTDVVLRERFDSSAKPWTMAWAILFNHVYIRALWGYKRHAGSAWWPGDRTPPSDMESVRDLAHLAELLGIPPGVLEELRETHGSWPNMEKQYEESNELCTTVPEAMGLFDALSTIMHTRSCKEAGWTVVRRKHANRQQ